MYSASISFWRSLRNRQTPAKTVVRSVSLTCWRYRERSYNSTAKVEGMLDNQAKTESALKPNAITGPGNMSLFYAQTTSKLKFILSYPILSYPILSYPILSRLQDRVRREVEGQTAHQLFPTVCPHCVLRSGERYDAAGGEVAIASSRPPAGGSVEGVHCRVDAFNSGERVEARTQASLGFGSRGFEPLCL